MDPTAHDPPTLSTCTTCQFVEDMSNYWTAVVYFKSRNGTYKRVPQVGQDNNGAKGGGMMVSARGRLGEVLRVGGEALTEPRSTTCRMLSLIRRRRPR